MKTNLRVVGTEFDIVFPPNETSTDRRSCIVTYRVTKHVRAAEFPGDKKGVLKEQLEPIKVIYTDK